MGATYRRKGRVVRRLPGDAPLSPWQHRPVRKLRVDAEYGTGSVWDDDWDGEREICPSLASLGASPELQADFDVWERTWEATFDADYPPDGGFASDGDRIAFNRAGEELTKRLGEELGPDVRVRFVPMEADSVAPNR